MQAIIRIIFSDATDEEVLATKKQVNELVADKEGVRVEMSTMGAVAAVNLYDRYLQWAFAAIIDLFSSVYHAMYSARDNVSGVPALGQYLQVPFQLLGDAFYNMMLRFWDAAAGLDLLFGTFGDVGDYNDIWDWVNPRFFDGRLSWDWWLEHWWNNIDYWFPWLRDPEYTIWEWIRWRVEALIPEGILSPWDMWNEIYAWVSELVDDLVPSMWSIRDGLYAWVVEEIVNRVPSWDDIYSAIQTWLQNNVPDLSELSIDPVRWIADRLEDALGLFLNVVGAPVRVIEAFVLRMWDTEE